MSSRAESVRVPAPLWRRLIALAVDALPAGGLGLIAVAIIIGSDPTPPEIPPWNAFDVVVDYINLETGRFLSSIVAVALLATVVQAFQVRRFGTTFGSHLLGLEARTLEDAQLPTSARALAWVFTGIALGAIGGLTWWWGFADMERRTLHDRIWRVGIDAVRHG